MTQRILVSFAVSFQPDEIYIPPRLVAADEVFFECDLVFFAGEIGAGDERDMGHAIGNRVAIGVLRESPTEIERSTDVERSLLSPRNR